MAYDFERLVRRARLYKELEGFYEMPSPEVSALFQKLMFSVGIDWVHGRRTTEYLDAKYLFIMKHYGLGRLILTWQNHDPVFALPIEHAIEVVGYIHNV